MAFRKPKPAGNPRPDKVPKPAVKPVKTILGAEDPAPVSLTALRRRGRR